MKRSLEYCSGKCWKFERINLVLWGKFSFDGRSLNFMRAQTLHMSMKKIEKVHNFITRDPSLSRDKWSFKKSVINFSLAVLMKRQQICGKALSGTPWRIRIYVCLFNSTRSICECGTLKLNCQTWCVSTMNSSCRKEDNRFSYSCGVSLKNQVEYIPVWCQFFSNCLNH